MLTMTTSPNAADLAVHAAPTAPIPAAAHIPGAATATSPATIANEPVPAAPLPGQPDQAAPTDDVPTKIIRAAA